MVKTTRFVCGFASLPLPFFLTSVVLSAVYPLLVRPWSEL
jgi:hypothetical protein